ncbi:MAG: mycothiol system anti-sigma-R factor [Actinomycetia bacterium]|nr:mycothiol system anti-sigma-R factor [Actinomycetes bacterium]
MGPGPGGIDCADVLNDVFLYLDDESDPQLRGRIRAHLDGCAPCLRQFGLEQDVLSLIARSGGGDVAPESLRARIKEGLDQVAALAATGEHRAE